MPTDKIVDEKVEISGHPNNHGLLLKEEEWSGSHCTIRHPRRYHSIKEFDFEVSMLPFEYF